MKFQRKKYQLLISGSEEEIQALAATLEGLRKVFEDYSQNEIGEVNLRLAGKSLIGPPYKERVTEEQREYLETRKKDLIKKHSLLQALVNSLEESETIKEV